MLYVFSGRKPIKWAIFMTSIKRAILLLLPASALGQSAKVDYICSDRDLAYAQFTFDPASGAPQRVDEFLILATGRKGKDLTLREDESSEENSVFYAEGKRYKIVTTPAITAANVRKGTKIEIFDSIPYSLVSDCQPRFKPEEEKAATETVFKARGDAMRYRCDEGFLEADFIFNKDRTVPSNVTVYYENKKNREKLAMKIDLAQSEAGKNTVFVGAHGKKMSGSYISSDNLPQAHGLTLADNRGVTIRGNCVPEI